jgi:Kef-type K+ transport system membrane component KefB
VSFGILALIVAAGLAGPLGAASRRPLVPVVVGELVAGVVVGRTGFGWIDASDPGLTFLGDVGFVILMLHAGAHVPVRDRTVRQALRPGLRAAVTAAVLAAPGGYVVARISGVGRPALWALLLFCGSAAIVVPALEDAGIADGRAYTTMVWATIADVSAIVAVPLVLEPSRALRAGLGGLVIVAVAAGAFLVVRHLSGHALVHELRHRSKKRGWALDLRLALLAVFTSAWLARRVGTSLLVPGFVIGLILAGLGGPKRLSQQIAGIGVGFFVPIFFVVLGARLDLGALVSERRALLLAVALAVANLAVHLATARLAGLGVAHGLVATAQLGVPAAVAAIGLDRGVLSPGVCAAILAAALATLAYTALGTGLAVRASAVVAASPASATPMPPAR